MEDVVTVEEFGRAARAKPFEPVTLYLTDGRTIAITHPEMIGTIGRTVRVHERGKLHVLDLLHITDIERTVGE